jgi:hypothetical protein
MNLAETFVIEKDAMIVAGAEPVLLLPELPPGRVPHEQRFVSELRYFVPPLPFDASLLLVRNRNDVVGAAIATLMTVPVLNDRQGTKRTSGGSHEVNLESFTSIMVAIIKKYNRMTGDGFAPANVAHVFPSLGFHIDTVNGQSHELGQVFAQDRLDRAKFRFLGVNDDVDVHKLEAFDVKPSHRCFQKEHRVSIVIGGILVREGIAYITHAGCTKECINDGMQNHIGITMPSQALFMFDPQTRHDQRTPFDQSMGIMP